MTNQAMADRPAVFNESTGAEYIGCSRNTLRKALADGAIPSRRIERRVFIAKSALDAWLATHAPVERRRGSPRTARPAATGN